MNYIKQPDGNELDAGRYNDECSRGNVKMQALIVFRDFSELTILYVNGSGYTQYSL